MIVATPRESARSPFGEWAATVGVNEPDSPRALPSRGLGAPRGWKRAAATEATPASAGSAATLASRVSDRSKHRPIRRVLSVFACRPKEDVGLLCRCSLGGPHESMPQWPCYRCGPRMPRAPAKKSRIVSGEECLGGLNPAGRDVERFESTFSRESISPLMIETKMAWEKAYQDAAEGAASCDRRNQTAPASHDAKDGTSVLESSGRAPQGSFQWRKAQSPSGTPSSSSPAATYRGTCRLSALARLPPYRGDHSSSTTGNSLLSAAGPMRRSAASGDWPHLYKMLAQRGQSTFCDGRARLQQFIFP